MNEEELFCKLFPDYAVNGKPLSPYFDLFESGYEQAENRIENLEKDKAYTEGQLDEQIQATLKLQKENAELKKELEITRRCWQDQKNISLDTNCLLHKAKELLKEFNLVLKERGLYHNGLYKRTKQFLNSEVEK